MLAPFATHSEDWCDIGGGGTVDVLRDANLTEVPDYCNDLNAMHEAEKVLISPASYTECLRLVVGPYGAASIFDYAHATARQRAEAFLKTLRKWKGEASNG